MNFQNPTGNASFRVPFNQIFPNRNTQNTQTPGPSLAGSTIISDANIASGERGFYGGLNWNSRSTQATSQTHDMGTGPQPNMTRDVWTNPSQAFTRDFSSQVNNKSTDPDLLGQAANTFAIGQGLSFGSKIGGELLSGGFGLIGKAMDQSFQREIYNDRTTALGQVGLPSFLAYGNTNLSAAMPHTTQMLAGSNTYTSKLPGNPSTSSFTGDMAQGALGWGDTSSFST